MYCKLINRAKAPVTVAQGRAVATAIGVNLRDRAQLKGLLETRTLDMSSQEEARGVVPPCADDT